MHWFQGKPSIFHPDGAAMHYAITNIDHPGRNWLRTDLRPKHIEYLRAPHEGVKLVLAGPFINEDNGEMIGSLLIVSADDVAAAERFRDGDPFASGGLFQSSDVRPWKWAIGAPESSGV
jgi:uncharacterized protein YciI